MRRFAPLLVVLFLSAALVAPVCADEFDRPPGHIAPPTLAPLAGPVPEIAPDKKRGDEPIPLDAALVKIVSERGFTLDETGTFTHESGTEIPREMLRRSGFDFDGKGRLVYKKKRDEEKTAVPVADAHIVPALEGLLPFARVAAYDPKEIGTTLQAWGLPVAFNGVHLLNPDGTATYYGMMLYEGLKDSPDARLNNLSGKRLQQSLDIFKTAFGEAFSEDPKAVSAPETARGEILRAWNILRLDLKTGEIPLKLEGYASIGDRVGSYRKGLEAEAVAAGTVGNTKRKAELDKYVATLNALENKRYYESKDLTSMVPSPGGEKKPSKEPSEPHHRYLPGLLKALDNFGGEPLSLKQKEALIKSFPMGETIWRMGAHELWKEGLTGKGIKVAVIDTGVGRNPELEGVVNKRAAYTMQRGRATMGSHATHVAGTIHALAPDAQINSYQALDEGPGMNPSLEPAETGDVKQRVMKAIDDAVADGNHVINMSLGGGAGPGSALAKKVEEYAKQGVIFVIAAGNSGGSGVEAPSIAENALTIGALDVNGRMTTFSSFGERWDPAKMSYAVKKVLMAPGAGIQSTTAVGGDDPEYDSYEGTSMATPHVAGSAALLLSSQLNPFAMARTVEKALIESAAPMSYDKLSPDVGIDQDFIVVDPVKAYQRLPKAKGSAG